MVYVDAEKLYSEVSGECRSIIHQAISILSPGAVDLWGSKLSPASTCYLLGFNATSFVRRELVEIPLSSPLLDPMMPINREFVQVSQDQKVGYAIMDTPQFGSGRSVGMAASMGQASGRNLCYLRIIWTERLLQLALLVTGNMC